jgi:hypothetical protein
MLLSLFFNIIIMSSKNMEAQKDSDLKQFEKSFEEEI